MQYSIHSRKGKVREQIGCPACPSSDAFTVYDQQDGTQDGYCFSCGYYTKSPYEGSVEPLALVESGTLDDKTAISAHHTGLDYESQSDDVVREGLSHPIKSLPSRMISEATALHFQVRTGVSPVDGETPIYTLYPRYRKGELVGFKKKTPSKEITSTGGGEIDLFGLELIKPTGKKLWITEGEEDAMALYQVLKEGSSIPDWEPPVISIPDGCNTAVNSITRCLDRIEGYEEIILVFDNDQPGKQARDDVCRILAGKVSYVTLPLKDSNDMLLKGRGKELKWLALSGAKKYQPDGILNAKDLWTKYTESKDLPSFPYPSHMVELNAKTYGVRPGSIVTVTAGTGSGKTQFLRELLYHYWSTTNEKIAGMFLEEDAKDTIQGLMALHLNKRIHLPDVHIDEDIERNAFDSLFSAGRISLYDYFGGMDDGSLLAKLRYFAVTGHRFIFLDHLSIIVSEYAAEGGERERIDTLMTKLAKFVKEFNIVLFLVVHLRKSDNSRTSFELGTRPSLDDLRGSGSLKQLSWDVIGLSRNQQHEDQYCANTTEVSVLKCRFTGRTGSAGYLHFDDHTGRLFTVTEPVGYRNKKTYNNSNEEF